MLCFFSRVIIRISVLRFPLPRIRDIISERFAEGRANVKLHLMDDDHMLHGSSQRIWAETRAHVAAWLPKDG